MDSRHQGSSKVFPEFECRQSGYSIFFRMASMAVIPRVKAVEYQKKLIPTHISLVHGLGMAIATPDLRLWMKR